MKIKIKVATRSKFEKIEEVAPNDYKIWIKEVPEKGKANERLVSFLADYFDLPKKSIKIILGRKNSRKIVEIDNFASRKK